MELLSELVSDGKPIVFSHLVFYTGVVERDAIYVMNADGSGLRNVTSKKRRCASDYCRFFDVGEVL